MTTLRPFVLLALGLGLATAACTNPGENNGGFVPSYPPTGSPGASTPTPQDELPPGTGAYSDPGIDISGGSLTTTVSGSSGKLSGARLRLYGTTMATTSVDASGKATLSPLAAATGYRLIVSADGYATQQLDAIEIKKKAETTETVTLQPQATVAGKVTANGQPVAGAVVSDGLNSAVTDAGGSYTLNGVKPGQVTLTVAKSRYQTASLPVTAQNGTSGQNVSLTAATPSVYFDATSPGVALSHFGQLQAGLAAKGWQVATQPPSNQGVWVLVSPSAALPDATVKAIVSFVAQGGKLVIFGEWGGYNGFANVGVNNVAHAVGLHFNPDLVRDPGANASHPEWLTISTFASNNSTLATVKGLKLYESSSVFGLDPMTWWARTTATGYRVQDNATPGYKDVVMAGPFKGGKAIAIGDSSAFSDDDTEGAGTPNIKQANNLELVTQLFDW